MAPSVPEEVCKRKWEALQRSKSSAEIAGAQHPYIRRGLGLRTRLDLDLCEGMTALQPAVEKAEKVGNHLWKPIDVYRRPGKRQGGRGEPIAPRSAADPQLDSSWM